MSRPLSIGEVGVEVTRLGDTLAASDGDKVSLQAQFVQSLAELEACAPDLERLEAELDRLVEQAATLALCGTPEQAMTLVRDLGALRGPRARLNGLADMITAASRLNERDSA